MPQSTAALAIIVPLVGAVLAWLAGRASCRLAEVIAVVAAAGTAAVSIAACWITAAGGGALEAGWLRVDALSGLLMAVIGLVSTFAVLFAGQHLRVLVCSERIEECRLPGFYALALLFLAVSMATLTVDHVIALVAGVQATVLVLALLVGFYWQQWAFAVRYKFFLPLLIGLVMTLLGAALVAPALRAASPDGTLAASQVGAAVSPMVAGVPGGAVLGVALLLVGLGTAAALAPFHVWIGQAHAEAPAPVGALISGALVPLGLYALVRVVFPFTRGVDGLQTALLLLGGASMLIGVALIAAEWDARRLLAHSTVSESGFVALGIGLAGAAGVSGALVALVAHSLAKSLLCLAAGAVEQ
ncbi:MAG: proton-conducting transporter membrane subunit, partial [Armatimonadota bacterium]